MHDMQDMHDADDNCKNFSSTPLVLLSCLRRQHALVLQPSLKTGARMSDRVINGYSNRVDPDLFLCVNIFPLWAYALS